MPNISAFVQHRDDLERAEFQYGPAGGRLSVAMDVLTDALMLVMQHGVYCQSARQPGKPAMDVQLISLGIEHAKELIASTLEEIRKQQRSS